MNEKRRSPLEVIATLEAENRHLRAVIELGWQRSVYCPGCGVPRNYLWHMHNPDCEYRAVLEPKPAGE